MSKIFQFGLAYWDSFMKSNTQESLKRQKLKDCHEVDGTANLHASLCKVTNKGQQIRENV